MKKVYIVYPEGDYAARRKTTNPAKREWYKFWAGHRELWRWIGAGLDLSATRRIVVDIRMTNDY